MKAGLVWIVGVCGAVSALAASGALPRAASASDTLASGLINAAIMATSPSFGPMTGTSLTPSPSRPIDPEFRTQFRTDFRTDFKLGDRTEYRAEVRTPYLTPIVVTVPPSSPIPRAFLYPPGLTPPDTTNRTAYRTEMRTEYRTQMRTDSRTASMTDTDAELLLAPAVSPAPAPAILPAPSLPAPASPYDLYPEYAPQDD